MFGAILPNAIKSWKEKNSISLVFNPLSPTAPFLYPQQTSENLTIFCFLGIEKGCIGNERVNGAIGLKNAKIVDIEKKIDKQGECDSADPVSSNAEFDIQDVIDIREIHHNNPIICYSNINNVHNEIVNLTWDLFQNSSRYSLYRWNKKETKIDPLFRDSQIHVDGYQFLPNSKDKNKNGEGQIVYVNNGTI